MHHRFTLHSRTARLIGVAVALFLTGALPALAQKEFHVTFQTQVLADSMVAIEWLNRGYSGHVRIDHRVGGGDWKLVASVPLTQKTGLVPWRTPKETTSDALLRFVVDGVEVARYPFAVVDRFRKGIDLVYPRGDETYVAGSSIPIRWLLTYAHGEPIEIIADFSSDGGETWTRSASVHNRFPYDSLEWVVPSDTTTRGQLRVRTSDGDAVDTSIARLKIIAQPTSDAPGERTRPLRLDLSLAAPVEGSKAED